ncbi:Holliday junction branch migration protein RuvA [bacterium]|nr:Holliday junction branch migration protein RuvA [bacterium]
MIEYLRGKVLELDDDHLVLDVNGVGYGIDVPQTTRDRLPAVGEEAALHVSLVVREDCLHLYGFAAPEERAVFEIFLNVSGIGPRTALDVLSTISISEFVSAIQFGNVQILTRVPGIGRKKAERLIVELKDRIKQFPVSVTSTVVSEAQPARRESASREPDVYEDALAAMQALGYSQPIAARCVTAALRQADPENVNVGEIVRLALQVAR